MSYSRPRKGFWGTEYIEHFDDSGNKTGESREVSTLFGGTKWVHHDAAGNKTGESRDMPSGILGGGPRTVHYDRSGHKTGETHDVTGLLGGTRRVHHDAKGRYVGQSQDVPGFLGGTKRVHRMTTRSGVTGPGQSPATGTRIPTFLVALAFAVAALLLVLLAAWMIAQRLG